MNNYKIKVKDEAESKEAQELFFELGYEWFRHGKSYIPIDRYCTHLTVYSDGRLAMGIGDAKKELTLPQLRDLVAQSKLKAQGLISGADALRALADGKNVQYRTNFSKSNWADDTATFSAEEILAEETAETDDYNSLKLFFRLKPQTIKLELEIPAPFEPEEDCHVYILDDGKTDSYRRYSFEVHGDKGNTFIGIWRTEEEIKQVVEQLRKIRGTNS